MGLTRLILAALLALSLFLALAAPPIVNDAQGLSTDVPSRVRGLQVKVCGQAADDIQAGCPNDQDRTI